MLPCFPADISEIRVSALQPAAFVNASHIWLGGLRRLALVPGPDLPSSAGKVLLLCQKGTLTLVLPALRIS